MSRIDEIKDKLIPIRSELADLAGVVVTGDDSDPKLWTMLRGIAEAIEAIDRTLGSENVQD